MNGSVDCFKACSEIDGGLDDDGEITIFYSAHTTTTITIIIIVCTPT